MSKRHHSGSRSQRQERVGELIRHALVDVFLRAHIRDPVLANATITVTAVDASPDLRHAKVFVMPLGGGHEDDILAALQRAAGFFGSEVMQRVTLKYAPRLAFQLDQSFDQASRIDEILQHPKVQQDIARPVELEEEEPDRDTGDGV